VEASRKYRQYDPPQGLNSEICPSATVADRSEAMLVEFAIGTRGLRNHHFGSALFNDPAWDILLVLHRARLQQQRITVSGICSSAGLPLATGIRWIANLVDAGHLLRVPDPYDGRRVFVELSQIAASAMSNFLKDLSTQMTFLKPA
jgi:DNA-binding MarR family transcriptional regulator